jgi:hypothetical protein
MAGDVEVDVNTLAKTNEPKFLTVKWLEKWSGDNKGIVNGGEAICNQPPDQKIMINATTPFGHGNLIYMMLTYTMPKLHYNLLKVDEHITVSPAYPEMYGRIIAKKRELEGHIKGGLASAAQAVADYELLKHDERKYREIMDYFEEGRKDEHVLRALFIDRIDAHTGEGYSMISMTKRWPTVITDFIRLSTIDKKDRSSTKKIRTALSISEAESTVLKTKNNVFEEWKKIFFPDIRDRYVRVKTLVDSRRKSIDEYREWLKPHITSLKMMKDTFEVNPSELFTMAIQPWHKPDSMYWVRVFMWKMLTPEEVGKPGFVEGEISPYDNFVKEYIPQIEKNYGVRIVNTEKDAEKAKEEGLKDPEKRVLTDDDIIIIDKKLEEWKEAAHYECEPKINPDRYYYAFYDLDIISPLFKMEGGKEEIDDWNCLLTPYLVSHNVLLVILLEITAREHWLNKYVKELIGVREVEDKIRDEVMKRYKDLEEEDEDKKGRGVIATIKGPYLRVLKFETGVEKSLGGWIFRNRKKFRRFLKYFMRVGPYETVRNERLSKMYGRYMGGGLTDPLIKYIKTQFGKLSGLQPP